ncbi:MAG: bifunctional hydroxymethylpyrimidine kinase/phosphomethylpyrimidine kinase [Alphaproteobacteria bacterium]|nr:bifunctional hydroxymethylpyrimidine kinase/phosphomethylpyrimidine kinase [Alphaproteobacteria bacterium]
MIPRILVIAGSDSSAGAGIQADLKTAFSLGVYAQTAITAVTVQNTLGVTGAHIVPPDVVRGQIIACLSDIGADAIKTGMLGSADMVCMVADTLAQHAPDIPLVVDPVMVAKGGSRLIDEEAVQTLKDRLLPMAALVTPNLPEAEALTGIAVNGDAGMESALSAFAAMGCPRVLLKGGHGDGPAVEDLLGNGKARVRLTAPRQDTPHTHGTGCTLATAVACGLAQGMALEDAVHRAHAYVQRAIATAPGLGQGHGPLNHG